MEVDSILDGVCALFPMRNFQYGLVAVDQLSGPKSPLILCLVIFPRGLQPGKVFDKKSPHIFKRKNKPLWNLTVEMQMRNFVQKLLNWCLEDK
jgi:hypothetical protein